MTNKNPNPKVISSSDARVEGQLQIEDSVVLDPRQNGTGDPLVLTANDDSLQVNGFQVVALDEDGKLDPSTVPDINIISVTVVEDEEEQLDLEAQVGDVAVRSDQGIAYMHNGGSAGTIADWTQISFVPVTSVAGKTGEVDLEKADITDFSDSDYAAAEHNHAVADITDFDPDDKADAEHDHVKADITDFSDSDYAAAEHDHVKADITDFDEADYTPSSALGRETWNDTVTVAEAAEVPVNIEDLSRGEAYVLWKITTDKPARIRVYATDADRTADASRAEGDPPAAGVGLVTEIITTSSLLSLPLVPPQIGANLEDPVETTIPILVENQGTGANVEITLEYTALGNTTVTPA